MRKLHPLSSVPVNKKQIIVGIGLGLSALFPLYAYAGCSQGDMTGTWYTYSSSDDSAGGFYPHTNRCKVKLNSSGNIVASKSSCKMRNAAGLISLNVTGGKVKVNSGCSLSGSMKISSIYGVDVITLEYGTLSKDKSTLSLVSYDTDNPTFVTHLTAVKK